eukprot:6592705-Prymnesium_polylepis.1
MLHSRSATASHDEAIVALAAADCGALQHSTWSSVSIFCSRSRARSARSFIVWRCSWKVANCARSRLATSCMSTLCLVLSSSTSTDGSNFSIWSKGSASASCAAEAVEAATRATTESSSSLSTSKPLPSASLSDSAMSRCSAHLAKMTEATLVGSELRAVGSSPYESSPRNPRNGSRRRQSSFNRLAGSVAMLPPP